MRFMLPLKHFMPLCDAVQYSNIVEEGPEGRKLFTLEDARRMARERLERQEEMCGYGYESETEDEEEEEEKEEEKETWGFDQEYEMSKSRNRHHTLRDKRRSIFRRPLRNSTIKSERVL
jgi:hypothetical protein